MRHKATPVPQLHTPEGPSDRALCKSMYDPASELGSSGQRWAEKPHRELSRLSLSCTRLGHPAAGHCVGDCMSRPQV